jgi:protein-tyrosine phosphatase
LNTVGYIDLHSHVLPGLDDGAPDVDASMTMLRALSRMGFEAVCATPHQKASQFLPSLHEVQEAHQAARARLAAENLPLRLGLAAENYWDDVLFERWRGKTIPSYDDGRAFLFEIPTEETPARMEDTLFQMALEGKLPVMAHPERYRPYWGKEDQLAELGRRVALVVDLGAVAGYHGWRAKGAARRLVSERIAHAVATDVHSPGDTRIAALGIAWIQKKLGPGAVRRLLADNPRAILAGELPDP